MAVIDGNVMAINPGEEAKMQMFIWNNIFFSLGFDVRDHYKELGGDAAAFVAPVRVLIILFSCNSINIREFHFLVHNPFRETTYRVSACIVQSIYKDFTLSELWSSTIEDTG